MPKPENAGAGLVGKTRVLTEDAGGHPAGTAVTIVGKERNKRTVEPADGGDAFEVTANQLGGADDADEADDAEGPTEA